MEFKLPKSFWWTQAKTYFSTHLALSRFWKDIYPFHWCFLLWIGSSADTTWSRWQWACHCLCQPWFNQLWAQLLSYWDRMLGCSLGHQIFSSIFVWHSLSLDHWSFSTTRYTGKVPTNWKSCSLDSTFAKLPVLNHPSPWQNQFKCWPTFSHPKPRNLFISQQWWYLINYKTSTNEFRTI